ncbi:hypothetical protein B9Z65_4139 [Elsinoe australis]|uniref:Uncharacterized protein n=1 Tax=Elsinoe australis TaxID=40998 RepID=A0A2P7Z1Y3_9PEZI|nr:hypothetical protein B9Z65_4139 [Elsinoe australis]
MAPPQIPTPKTRDLLPPLLACLPTAFVSPRPPPALLPLLSPILRQRIQYAGNVSGTDGWLSLLSWDPQRASKLAGKVEGLQLEPHPVSGEVEVEDVKSTEYRKLDEETIQARLHADEFDLLPVYVWCETDTQGGSAGWKLAELRALEDREDGTEWYSSLSEAIEASSHYLGAKRQQANGTTSQPKVQDEDDDDDYWASYDRTPARTPAKRSPAPGSSHVFSQSKSSPIPSSSEDDYYSRYTTVQPAMDDHDPDEASAAADAGSTLQGNSLVTEQPTAETSALDRPTQRSLYPADAPKTHPDSAIASQTLSQHASNDLSPTVAIAPRPISPASSTRSTKSIEKWERTAQVEADMTRAETGVKQFIGSEIRNLFRLARNVGIERGEFDEVVRRELEVVGMLEDA